MDTSGEAGKLAAQAASPGLPRNPLEYATKRTAHLAVRLFAPRPALRKFFEQLSAPIINYDKLKRRS